MNGIQSSFHLVIITPAFLLPLPKKGLNPQDWQRPPPHGEDGGEEMPGKVPDGALNEDPLLGLCEVVLLTFGERNRKLNWACCLGD